MAWYVQLFVWGLDAGATISAILLSMWPSFDPEMLRTYASVRELVRLSHQSPTREWPLIVMKSENLLFVIREWPNGSITAYTIPIDAPPA